MTHKYMRTWDRQKRFEGYLLLMVAVAIAMFFLILFKWTSERARKRAP